MPWRACGPPVLMLTPEAQLLHLCAHTLQHGVPHVRWTYDIALLLTRWSIDWGEVLATAPVFGLTLALQSTLAAVRDLWGVPLPPAVDAQLRALAVPWGERALRAFIIVEHGRAVAFLDGLGEADPRVTMAVWWHMTFPSPVFMRRRYGCACAYALPVLYAYRAATGAFRSGRAALCALWRMTQD